MPPMRLLHGRETDVIEAMQDIAKGGLEDGAGVDGPLDGRERMHGGKGQLAAVEVRVLKAGLDGSGAQPDRKLPDV